MIGPFLKNKCFWSTISSRQGKSNTCLETNKKTLLYSCSLQVCTHLSVPMCYLRVIGSIGMCHRQYSYISQVCIIGSIVTSHRYVSQVVQVPVIARIVRCQRYGHSQYTQVSQVRAIASTSMRHRQYRYVSQAV